MGPKPSWCRNTFKKRLLNRLLLHFTVFSSIQLIHLIRQTLVTLVGFWHTYWQDNSIRHRDSSQVIGHSQSFVVRLDHHLNQVTYKIHLSCINCKFGFSMEFSLNVVEIRWFQWMNLGHFEDYVSYFYGWELRCSLSHKRSPDWILLIPNFLLVISLNWVKTIWTKLKCEILSNRNAFQ